METFAVKLNTEGAALIGSTAYAPCQGASVSNPPHRNVSVV